jgi:hypothetical protein
MNKKYLERNINRTNCPFCKEIETNFIIKEYIKENGFGKLVDLFLEEKVRELCEREKGNIEAPIEECKIIITDTFVEVIEKFIISHIRNWQNESDARRPDATVEELGKNRLREIENNGRIRPRLVQALSEMMQTVIDGKLQIVQKSVKMYDEQGIQLSRSIATDVVSAIFIGPPQVDGNMKARKSK